MIRASFLSLLLLSISLFACLGQTEDDDPPPATSSSSSGNGGRSSGNGSGVVNAPATTVANQADCPANYSHTFQDKKCPTAGLDCAYPGRGDCDRDGNCSTAIMICRKRGDAGGATWSVAQ